MYIRKVRCDETTKVLVFTTILKGLTVVAKNHDGDGYSRFHLVKSANKHKDLSLAETIIATHKNKFNWEALLGSMDESENSLSLRDLWEDNHVSLFRNSVKRQSLSLLNQSRRQRDGGQKNGKN